MSKLNAEKVLPIIEAELHFGSDLVRSIALVFDKTIYFRGIGEKRVLQALNSFLQKKIPNHNLADSFYNSSSSGFTAILSSARYLHKHDSTEEQALAFLKKFSENLTKLEREHLFTQEKINH